VKASGSAWHHRGEFTADFDESKAASTSFQNFIKTTKKVLRKVTIM